MKTTVFFATLIMTLGLNASTYNVDTSHSAVGFKVRHMMVSYVRGSFDEYSGTVEYDEKTKTITGLEGEVKTATINTGNFKRDTHLKGTDFFDAPSHPIITFSMTSLKGDTMTGILTMNGVSKAVEFETEFGGVVKDPWGLQRMGLVLEGTIDRRDFGLKYNSILDNGGIGIGNEVKISVELEAVKK